MMVELAMLPECMRIWDIKAWLTDPSKNNPLSCFDADYDCRCRNIVETLWYDGTFRRILTEAGISRHDDHLSTLREIQRLVIDYAKKLYSGEEVVSQSNRALNVLTSSHAKRLATSVAVAVRCKERNWQPRPWQI